MMFTELASPVIDASKVGVITRPARDGAAPERTTARAAARTPNLVRRKPSFNLGTKFIRLLPQEAELPEHRQQAMPRRHLATIARRNKKRRTAGTFRNQSGAPLEKDCRAPPGARQEKNLLFLKRPPLCSNVQPFWPCGSSAS